MALGATERSRTVNSPASPSFTLTGLRSAGEIHDAEKHQTQNLNILLGEMKWGKANSCFAIFVMI